MGVDYSPVGGVGLLVTDEIKNKLIVANEGECYGGCVESILGDLELTCEEAGAGNYTGEENEFYIMVDGETLTEINENSIVLIEKLKEYGVEIGEDDLVIISELHVY